MKKKIFFPIIFASAICPIFTISSCQKNDVKIEGIESYSAHLEKQTYSSYYDSCMEIIFSENIKEARVHANQFDITGIEISGKKMKSRWGQVKPDHYETG